MVGHGARVACVAAHPRPGYADIAITAAAVFEERTGVVGTLTGTLTARTTRRAVPADDGRDPPRRGRQVRGIDVYTENPDELAAFYARAEAGTR